MPEVWEVFAERLADSANRFSVILHGFVLMANHFHLVAHSPLANLDRFLRHLLTEVARELQRRSSRINHIFGGRSSQSLLVDPHSVSYVYKYVLRNPVRAEICSRVQDYSFSSLSRLMAGNCDIPIASGIRTLWSMVPKEEGALLSWLNIPTLKELESLIGNGLRRSKFQFTRSNSARRDHFSLSESYCVHPSHDPYLLGPWGE